MDALYTAIYEFYVSSSTLVFVKAGIVVLFYDFAYGFALGTAIYFIYWFGKFVRSLLK